jgi:DNA-binding transcriptional LysR family regulator
VLDVQGFPFMRSWYVVHRRSKRLPPVAEAFREFLLAEGAALIESITRAGVRAAKVRGRRTP